MPRIPEDFIKEGVNHYKNGRKNKALGSFKKALQIDPNNTSALFNISEVLIQLEKYSKAKDYVLKLLKLTPKDWAVHDMLATIYTFEGFLNKALQHLTLALKFAPSDVMTDLNIKLDALKENLESVKTRKKLAIVCAKGLDNFIDDIIKGLFDEYWIQRWTVMNNKEIKLAIDWADIVWFEWANEVAIIGSNYPGISKKKTIVRLHSYEVFTSMPMRINWKNVDTLIFVADHIRRIFKRYLIPDIDEKVKTVIIQNGINLKKIPFKERKPGYNIAWVAHINYKKNPQMMLQIIRKLVEIDSNYKLHVAGDFQDLRYKVYLEYMIKEMNIKDNVIFYGWVDDMDEWWEDKDYLLSTSIHEGHPYNIMEGMAYGIKPIIHNYFGAKETWPKNCIFNTVDEAVTIITEEDYNSKEYRKFVEKYSVDKQISEIKGILI